MRNLYIIFFSIWLLSCNYQDKRPLVGKTIYQQRLNAQFKDATKSPLKKKDLKNFKGLDFFPIDSSYIVTAILERTPNTPFLEMPTSDNSVSYYREFGEITFTLHKKELNLTLYQSLEEYKDSKYKDYLFLPFTDETSGKGSYGGGRYMDLFKSSIQKDETIELNFNNTYNPYCTYNEEYSCPLTPTRNHLNFAVKAGIKNFKKNN
tara:strand:- start:20043 stop:20660 length:618 start_codon:yes stop_codon:yes gene_type:complete